MSLSSKAAQISPRLAALCGVTAKDSNDDAFTKVRRSFEKWISEMPGDLPDILASAFGIGETYSHHVRLTERLDVFSSIHQISIRTAHRWMDEALSQFAEIVTDKSVAATSTTRSNRDWHARSVRTIVLVRKSGIEVLEFRTIVCESKDLRRIELGFSTPKRQDSEVAPQRLLTIDALHGGNIVEVEIETSARVGFALELSRALKLGEVYDYAVRFRLPPEAEIMPYYTLVPYVSCDEFDLTVKFEELPDRVEILGGVLQADTVDWVLKAPAIEIDPLGEVRARFRNLQPRMAYGVRWKQG